MKKLNRKVAVLIWTTALFAVSCSKEEQKGGSNSTDAPSIKINTQEVTQDVQSKDGTLIFENEQHMMNELETLAKMNLEEKIKWENKYNFRSLGSIEMLINNAELEKQNAFYKNLNPDLKIADYEAMNYKYLHTDIYKKYLAMGVIEEEVDADGNHSFSLNMKNSGLANVLNDQGEVIVGGSVYHFSGFEGSIASLLTNEVTNTFSILPNTAKQNQFNWSKGYTTDGWLNLSSNERISYKVIGYDLNTSSPTLVGSTFYVNAKAQKKSFGTWSYSNNYNPVYRITGSWTYSFSVIPNGSFSSVIINSTDNPPLIVLNDNDAASPLNFFVNGGNASLAYCKPNGSWVTPSIYEIYNSINVNHTFTFSFSGGCCGYNYTVSNP